MSTKKKARKMSWLAMILGLSAAAGADRIGDAAAAEEEMAREIRSSVAPNRCLDVAGAGTAWGTNVQIWECNKTVAQQWSIMPNGEIRSSVAPNRCLDVSGAGVALGTNVQIWECNDTVAQRWDLR